MVPIPSFSKGGSCFLARGTRWTKPAYRQIGRRHFVSRRQVHAGQGCSAFQINIENAAAPIAIKMAMFAEVGAKTGRSAVKGHLSDQMVFHQCAKAVVNGGKAQFRH